MSNAPISNASALQIIRDATDKSFSAAAKSEQAGLSSQLGAKSAQVDATVKQHKGEQIDSVTKFSASLAGMGLNAKTSVMANKPLPPIRQQKDAADAAYTARLQAARSDLEAHKSALNSASQGGQVSNIVTTAHDALSQAIGGQAMAHKAQIDSKALDVQDTAAKMQYEGGKDAKQAAGKAQDGVTEMARALYDRAKQVADRIFG